MYLPTDRILSGFDLTIICIGDRGGWVAVQALDDLAEHFMCGVIAHPSIQVEDKMGGNAVELCEKVNRPILLMPTKSDPESYLEGGEMFMAIQKNNPESQTVFFGDVKHGFVPRGDLSDSVVKENVDAALNRTYAYFSKFM
jgi:dienelactone hydrolase